MASAPKAAADAAGCEETACRSRGDMFRAMKRMAPAAGAAQQLHDRGACACGHCVRARARASAESMCACRGRGDAQGATAQLRRRRRRSARRFAKSWAEPAGRWCAPRLCLRSQRQKHFAARSLVTALNAH